MFKIKAFLYDEIEEDACVALQLIDNTSITYIYSKVGGLRVVKVPMVSMVMTHYYEPVPKEQQKMIQEEDLDKMTVTKTGVEYDGISC